MSVESTSSAEQKPAFLLEGVLQPGLPITWDDLQNGRLIQRPVFEALRQTFEEWRAQGTNWSAKTPAVFCIRGRAGEGKSALLLQLAATLANEVKFSFKNASHDPRQFALPPESEAWQFVDELPGAVHGEVGRRWIKSLRANLPRYVVTTATPAAGEWLMSRYPKVLAWTIWDLPALTENEAALLAEKLGVRNLWRPGDTIEEFLFACKYGARVKDSNAALQQALLPLGIERLPVVWAANALKLGVPASLPPPDFRDKAKDLPLPVHVAADGLHLTSPRLALPLLNEWFSDLELRLHQLSEGFESLLDIWLKDGQPQWASWFLRRLLHSEHFTAIFFARVQRKSLFRQMYERHRQRYGGLPAPELLAAWLEIGSNFRLKPDPVADAADMLEKNLSLPPTLVADIWLRSEHRKTPLRNRVVIAATKFFQQTQADAGSAVLRLYSEANHIPPVLTVAQRWLETHRNHKLFNDILTALFERSYGHASISRWARQSLHLEIHCDAEGKTPAKASKREQPSADVHQRAHKWVRPNVEAPETGALLLQLLRGGKGQLNFINWALLWTANFPRHAATPEVWGVLLKEYGERDNVRQIALEWIRELSELPLVPEMLVMMAGRLRNEPEFAALACGWLAKHPEHVQTPKLLEALASSRLENVRAQTGQWLDARPRHDASARLLAAVLSSGALDAAWFQRAEKFFQSSGHPDPLRPLRALLATKPNEQIIALALTSLPKLPLAQQEDLVHCLGNAAANQPELAATPLNALRDNPQWSKAFFGALAEKLLDKRIQIQTEWLQRGFDKWNEDDAQKLLAHALERTAPLPQPLSQALADWLQRHRSKRSYRRMVESLRCHPAQGRYFHSASMLPLNILADVLKPSD